MKTIRFSGSTKNAHSYFLIPNSRYRVCLKRQACSSRQPEPGSLVDPRRILPAVPDQSLGRVEDVPSHPILPDGSNLLCPTVSSFIFYSTSDTSSWLLYLKPQTSQFSWTDSCWKNRSLPTGYTCKLRQNTWHFKPSAQCTGQLTVW